jgi:pimeloyl-ACP methyl ester carboxylesterase
MPFLTAAAALGYAVWVPDYSGMGDGRGIHAYCVAESLADSALDGLAAARQWLRQATAKGRLAYRESGRLAIIGYSAGGLTVMGALRAIADKRIPTPGLRLIAVYPMGAPLNLALGVSYLGATPYVLNHPEYQIFLALGWMRVYPEQFKLTDVLLTGTIEKIVPLFDGTRNNKNLNRKIAKIVGKKVGSVTDSDIFVREYLSVLRRDPASTAYYRLQEENRLDRWTPPPGIPIIFAATPTDEVVPFANSSNEYDWARENAPLADVTLVRLASTDHISAGVEAFLFSIVDLEKREATLRPGLD